MDNMNITQISVWLLTGVTALLIAGSAFAKFSNSQKVVDSLTKTNVLDYIKLLGIAELVFLALFLYPRTSNIGFVLLACYFSGALAVEISHRASLVGPLVILGLVFLITILRSPALFLP